MNDIGDIVDVNNSMPQSWTGSRAGNSSFGGILKGCEALDGLGNVIPTTVSEVFMYIVPKPVFDFFLRTLSLSRKFGFL